MIAPFSFVLLALAASTLAVPITTREDVVVKCVVADFRLPISDVTVKRAAESGWPVGDVVEERATGNWEPPHGTEMTAKGLVKGLLVKDAYTKRAAQAGVSGYKRAVQRADQADVFVTSAIC
ncbi:hypothetical protein PsYK624_119480 [Phanerochaete sordida]|uniref:Uncharacterized protein n=1 Tax=Phanerochaete sordida TaxID=48140 RepID=A0A9P3GJ66_9APHY|nr:hypothetical protein PsYK624_119480 [Phanerochaete sordida]